MNCPICGGVGHFFIQKEHDRHSYSYYMCEKCESIYLDSTILERIDKGESIVSYAKEYWDSDRIHGGEQRTFGPNIARMAEVFFYARRPIKRFLDIGGGNGKFLDAVERYLPCNKDIFYSVEKYPPPSEYCTQSKNYYTCSYHELNMKFDAGICIEVIEHLTPRMLSSMFSEIAKVSNEAATYLINSGQPEFVKNENPNYLEPFKDGHIMSYSLQALQRLLSPLGYNVKRIKGKSWACLAEYQSDLQDEVVDRVWTPLAENMAILEDKQMGSVLRILGMESIRAYSDAADIAWLSKLRKENER